MTYSLRLSNQSDLPQLVRLLEAAELPVADIGNNAITFWLAEAEGELLGCVGMEVFESLGLLRSLAVVPAFQSQGVAAALVLSLIGHAEKSGVSELYLLTTTAETYFLKKGFEVIAREFVPLAIKKSSEFQDLCPASAVVMRLKIS